MTRPGPVPSYSEADLAVVQDTSLSLREAADKLGRPLQTVARWRQGRGIQSVKVNRAWTTEEYAVLGDTSLSIQAVSDRIGRSMGACYRKAGLLGTGPRSLRTGRTVRPRTRTRAAKPEAEIRDPRPANRFSAQEDALLHEMNWQVPLAVMAGALGRSPAAVGKRLHRLGLRDGFPTGVRHHWWNDGASQNPAYGWRGTDWPEVRADVLERDGFVCQDGGEFFPSGEGLVVHHVIPWRLRPVNDQKWLVTLCVSHHMRRPEHGWTEIPDDVASLLTGVRLEGGELLRGPRPSC